MFLTISIFEVHNHSYLICFLMYIISIYIHNIKFGLSYVLLLP